MDTNPTNLEAIGTRWFEETLGLASHFSDGQKSALIREEDGGRFEAHIADISEVLEDGVYPNSNSEIQPVLEGFLGTRIKRLIAVRTLELPGNTSGLADEADWFVESLTGVLYRISYRKD